MTRSWDKLYSFTTENIASYISSAGAVGNRVLCVGGSGDHLLNAALYGGRSFFIFDINPLSAFWIELKIAAIKILTFQEFKRFFLRSSSSALNHNVYKKISLFLSRQTQAFFDSHYQQHAYDGSKLRNSELFNLSYDIDELKILSNKYLQDAFQYKSLQMVIAKCRWKFTTSCITDVTKLLHGETFDTIFLSNISDYIEQIFTSSVPLQSFVDDAIFPFTKILSTHGQIFAAYLYDTGSKNRRSCIDHPVLRKKAFTNDITSYKEVSFPGVKENTFDAVVVISLPHRISTNKELYE